MLLLTDLANLIVNLETIIIFDLTWTQLSGVSPDSGTTDAPAEKRQKHKQYLSFQDVHLHLRL